MSTLLLRLAGPMQAWGSCSYYERRRMTEKTPTKSGVIGLIAAALGCRRDNDDMIDYLTSSLRMGVRVDREGKIMEDYHIAHAVGISSPIVSNRQYLSDAIFVVGLESEDDDLLHRIDSALHAPAFAVYLGRRSCLPSNPLALGVHPQSLEDALRSIPWQESEWRKSMTIKAECRFVLEGDNEDRGVVTLRRDRPESFNFAHREYGFNFWTECEPIVLDVNSSHD